MDVEVDFSSGLDGDGTTLRRAYNIAELPIEHSRDGRLGRTCVVILIHMSGWPSWVPKRLRIGVLCRLSFPPQSGHHPAESLF